MARWLSCWLRLRLSVAVLAGEMLGSLLAPMVASASSGPTWTGNGDGTSWGDSHNWDTMQVPKNGDSVTVGPTSSQLTPHVTGVPGGTQLQDLTLSNASLSGGDVTVMGSFSWDVSMLTSVITGTSPGTQFGQLSVGGQATLSGTLQVNTGGGFIAAHGQAFPVLVCNSRSGTFATLSGHPAYTVAYRATAARAVYP